MLVSQRIRSAVALASSFLLLTCRSLHIRNKHQGRYDFKKLISSYGGLQQFTIVKADGEPTINFSDPLAVKALNQALLQAYYNVKHWSIPEYYLCPSIPGRADYIHNIADILNEDRHILNNPSAKPIHGLDIGVGASLVYPLIGIASYENWKFTGSEVDEEAYHNACQIMTNNQLTDKITIRKQTQLKNIFLGGTIIPTTDKFDFTMCNPPFHASLDDAREGTTRKWNNLGRSSLNSTPIKESSITNNNNNNNNGNKGSINNGKYIRSTKPVNNIPILNFGGQGTEIVYEGGETMFIRRMIEQSKLYANNVLWFTCMVSKQTNLPFYQEMLESLGTQLATYRIIEMELGQKKSRILAWTYHSKTKRMEW